MNKKKFTNNYEDNNEEEMIDEVLDLNQPADGRPKANDPLQASDPLGMSGGISSSGANAIDHSIDTL